MTKQTAVEWLVKELNLEGYDYTVKQAKEMEKQQIENAFASGIYDGGENVSQYNMSSEQYYNETFGGGEQ